MKEIRLIGLTLRDFQGGNFNLDAQGLDVYCYAANAAGKTRLNSAFTWLLFNKDSLGRTDFDIKNKDATGAVQHNLEHSVEAVLTINGEPITLRKTYFEKWVKGRGKAEAEFSGHTNEFFIDGVPVKKNEFDTKITEIAGPEETFRLLTSPTVFPSLPWQRQRSILLECCGDITDAQVIDTNGALSPLTDLLKKYSVSKTPLDDLRKVVMSQRTEINKRLEQLPVRIDEVHRGLPDIKGLDRKEIENNVARLEIHLNGAKLKLHGIDNGSGIAELSKKLAGINNDISLLEQRHYNETMLAVGKLNQKITDITNAAQANSRKMKSLEDEMNRKQTHVSDLDKQLDELRAKWTAVDAETFQDTTSDTCAACDQTLPADRVEAARNKALAAFNLDKAERLDAINQKGRRLKDDRDAVNKEIEAARTEFTAPQTETQSTDTLIQDRDALKEKATDYTGITERTTLIFERDKLSASINEARESVSVDKEAVDKEIADLEEQLKEAKAEAAKFTNREQGEARVQELKAEEKKLAAEFEKLEKTLYLCELFIKTKVGMLTERINQKFEVVRFNLFQQNINGGIEPCCVATVGGIPYDSGLNSAARAQGGLDIIRTLQKHYGLMAPVFIDNRESVTEIPDMACQTVSLIVSPEDKVLRVETVNKNERKVA